MLVDKLLESGVQDYIVKGGEQNDILQRTLHHAIERQKLVGSLEREHGEQAEFVRAIRSGEVDTIAGLGTRAKFIRLLDAGVVEENERLVLELTRTNKELTAEIAEHKRAEEERLRLLTIEHERNNLRDTLGAMERVLGVVGHELRTPLAGVRAMAEFLLLEDARETQEFDTFLKSIHDEVIKMAGIVNDTLEVTRMSSGTAKWNWSGVPVAQVCDEALETLRPLVHEEKVDLQLDVRPENLVMQGDAGAIRRLVVNLVSNSSRHTSEGQLFVEATRETRDGLDFVRIQVRDTGEGMPPEIASRLGEAFALNSGMIGESHVKGSGLGLAICRGIVAAHGGTISVETELGEGTTVTVLLRADLSEPASVQSATNITCKVLS